MTRAAASSVVALLVAACGAERDPVESAWRDGVAFLASQQRADGAIASDHYGVLRAGRSTTAVAVYAILCAPDDVRAASRGVAERGMAFLRGQVDAEGAVVGDGRALDYPNYTAAFMLLAIAASGRDGFDEVRDRIVGRLRRVQWAGARGVDPSEPAYGGFDLGMDEEPWRDGAAPGVDLSTTSWVLEGLRAAGAGADDPAVRAARVFVERCQRWPGDGGFVFSPSSELRPAKAGDGVAYGTATADGLRALRLCGLSADHPRVAAATGWLRERFDAARVPGFPTGLAALEQGLRIYWLCAATRALGPRADVRAQVLRLQRPDGSFVGPSPLMKEDDPLVATPLSLLALRGFRLR